MFDNYQAKPDAVRAALDEAPKIGESLCAACGERFAVVRRDLDATASRTRSCRRSCAGSTTTRARRGSSSGPLENENATLSGGGRYDYLVEEIGGPPTPGVGFGAGIERLLLALEAEGVDGGRPPRSTSSSRSTRAHRASVVASWLAQLRASRGLRRHRLCGPLAEGAAHAGRPPRRRDDVVVDHRRATLRRPGSADEDVTHDELVGEAAPDDLARPHVRRAARRARRQAADARRLGRHAARPRRARVRRPPRPHRDDAARDQSGALAGGRRARARRSATSSCSGPTGEVVARAPETGEPEAADRRGGAPGRRARDRLALDAAPVPARRGGRRRDAAAALPLARHPPRPDAAQPPAVAHGHPVDPAARWTSSASSTSGRRA